MKSLGFNEQQLQKMKTHPGFIAALDQSGGSTPGALRLYGIKEGAWSNEETFAIVHQMRTRIITSPPATRRPFSYCYSLARQPRDIAGSNVVRATTNELDSVIAMSLETLATRAAGGSGPPIPALEDALNVFESSTTDTDALNQEAAAHFAGRLAIYRTLVAAINRLSSESLNEAVERNLNFSNVDMVSASRSSR